MVSIIVPVYNTEQFLHQCIESIINQTYKNIEIILIDDGSTDKSGKICDEYAANDNRIKTIHNINSGVSIARNIGLDNAKGKYITFIDSDDYVEKNYIETLVNAIETNNAELAICGIKEITDKITKVRKPRGCYTGSLKNDYYAMIDFPCLIGAKIYLKKILDSYKIRFVKKIKYAEDELFNLMYYQYVKMYIFVDSPLYVYKHRKQSLSDIKLLKNKENLKNYIFKLKKEDYYLEKLNVNKKDIIIGEQAIRAILNFTNTNNYIVFIDEIKELRLIVYKDLRYNKFSKIVFALLLKLKLSFIIYCICKIRNRYFKYYIDKGV